MSSYGAQFPDPGTVLVAKGGHGDRGGTLVGHAARCHALPSLCHIQNPAVCGEGSQNIASNRPPGVSKPLCPLAEHSLLAQEAMLAAKDGDRDSTLVGHAARRPRCA